MNNMKKTMLVLLLIPFISWAQVGVNTSTPNGMLDVQSTNSGILIPRVQLTTIIDNTTVINPSGGALTTSTLVYNIAPSGTDEDFIDVGFHYWDNIAGRWIPIARSDYDWIKEGTLIAPTSITDNMFHLGDVAIGKNTANYPLDIESSTKQIGIKTSITGNFKKTGISSSITLTSGNQDQKGIESEINSTISSTSSPNLYSFKSLLNNTGEGENYGFHNTLNNTNVNATTFGIKNILNISNNATGIENNITITGNPLETTGTKNNITGTNDTSVYGIKNTLLQTGNNGNRFGSYNDLTNSFGSNLYGTYNILTAGNTNRFGSYNEINNALGFGNNYGIYSKVLTAGSENYAGYFLGNVAIGRTDLNKYILPQTRGTNGQIMQTDGSGNVTWGNPTTINKSAAIKIKPTANITGFGNGTERNLFFDSIDFNLGGGNYNTSTGTYTVPYDGIYNINAKLGFIFASATATSLILSFRIYVNGAFREQIVTQFLLTSSSYLQSFQYNLTQNLTANDLITFRIVPVWQVASTAPYIGFNFDSTSIAIFKVY